MLLQWSAYRRFQPKPPPIVVKQEPMTFGGWLGLIVVLALIVGNRSRPGE
jgi:hypothetical protein